MITHFYLNIFIWFIKTNQSTIFFVHVLCKFSVFFLMLNSNIFISLVPVLIKMWMLLWTPFMQSPYIFFFHKCSDLSITSPLVCSFSLFLTHTFPSFIFKKKGAFIVSFLYILYINDLVKHVNDRWKHLAKVLLTKCRWFKSC